MTQNGTIRYSDSFGGRHQTCFRAYYWPDGPDNLRFAWATDGNTAD